MPESVTLTLAFGKTVDDTADLLTQWCRGKDFRMSTTRQCTSIRDLAYLKSDYDNIVLRAPLHDASGFVETCIFDHILRGLTSYV